MTEPELPSPTDPRLLDLRARYAQLHTPLREGAVVWTDEFCREEIDLTAFRADNGYMWQWRHAGSQPRITYLLYAYLVASTDFRGLLSKLSEDGAFGCTVFQLHGFPPISRDLLDSINEIYFLDRHWGLFDRQDTVILDIGAGYGRLAHRILEAVPTVREYLCADAIAESTFLSEWYLRHRQLGNRATVVRLDEVPLAIAQKQPDLAVNIRSFTEMPFSAVSAWVELITGAGVNAVLVIPNDRDEFWSREHDGSRVDCVPLMRLHGFELNNSCPVIADDDIRAYTGFDEHFMFFIKS